MDYFEFLNKIIEEGRAAAIEDYTGKPNKEDNLKGSLEGFEACRGKNPVELASILADAHQRVLLAFRREAPNYWQINCREAEIRFVCNVVSATMVNQGLDPIVLPSCSGVMVAARVLNGENCLVPTGESQIVPDLLVPAAI